MQRTINLRQQIHYAGNDVPLPNQVVPAKALAKKVSLGDTQGSLVALGARLIRGASGTNCRSAGHGFLVFFIVELELDPGWAASLLVMKQQ
jgi:hypothetical protein